MKKRTASILKWVGIILVALGFAYGALDFASRRALKREHDALRADGRPMELHEIVPPAIPVADNAALVYNAAIQMLKTEPPAKLDGYTPRSGRVVGDLFEQLGDVALKVQKNPADSVAAEHMAQLLDHPRVVEFLAAIEHGAARPGYRQELDFSQGAEILPPFSAENRHVSGTLSILARRQAAAGKTDAAWRTAILGLRLADSSRDEPLFLSQLLRIVRFDLALDALRAVAAVAPPTADDFARAERLLESFESRAPLVLSLDAEILIMGQRAFKVPLLWGDTQDKLSVAVSAVPPLRRYDHAAYLRVMRGYLRNAAAPYAPGDSELGKQMHDAVPRYHPTTRMMTSLLSETKARFTTMIAQARVTRAGLAAIRFKQEHDAFPSDLQALKLANADDPFTGKPLVYRATDRGFTIYSVGVNLVDNGGTQRKHSKSGDQVWRYEERNPAESGPGE